MKSQAKTRKRDTDKKNPNTNVFRSLFSNLGGSFRIKMDTRRRKKIQRGEERRLEKEREQEIVRENTKRLDMEREKMFQTIYGVRFPWEVYFFLAIGALSEVADALFLQATLASLDDTLNSVAVAIISGIVGAGCFLSMAFVGFQLGNKRYYTKIGEWISYAFWAIAGIALVIAKMAAGLKDAGMLEAVASGESTIFWALFSEGSVGMFIIAIVQAVLYVGTGFMTRDSMKILTDNDLREYFLARREYERLLDELIDLRGDLTEDIIKLEAYAKSAKRLVKSKKSVMKNIAQYNEASRALVEAKMSTVVEPDLMEDMYDKVIEKEQKTKQ